MFRTMWLKCSALIVLWLCALVLPAAAQPRIPVPPSGTVMLTCQYQDAPYYRGRVYVDGKYVGNCPTLTMGLGLGYHSIRVGEALGSNRYLGYEAERVEVKKDVVRNLTAVLSTGTAESFPALVYAMGAKQYPIRPSDSSSRTGAFSPDASILALGAETNSIRLYNAADGEPLRRLGEPGEYWVSFVTAIAFSADSRLLASSGWLYNNYIGEINIWDVESGKRLRTIPDVKEVYSIALSRDGKFLAAGVIPNIVKVWSVSDGRLLWSISPPGGSEARISPLVFSPDGRYLLLGHQAGREIYVYDAVTHRYLKALPGNLAVVTKDGEVITCSAKEGEDAVRMKWRLPAGELIESKRLNATSVTRCLNEQRLVEASGRPDILDARNELLMKILNDPYHIAVTADGKRILFYANGDYDFRSLLAVPQGPP